MGSLSHLFHILPFSKLKNTIIKTFPTSVKLERSSKMNFESTISGISRRRSIDCIISDLIGAVVLGNSSDNDDDDDDGEEQEDETETKEEYSSFSLTTTTSGDEDEGSDRRQPKGY